MRRAQSLFFILILMAVGPWGRKIPRLEELLRSVVDIDGQEVTVDRVGAWVAKARVLSPVVPGVQGGWW
jgi:hypothetical protein